MKWKSAKFWRVAAHVQSYLKTSAVTPQLWSLPGDCCLVSLATSIISPLLSFISVLKVWIKFLVSLRDEAQCSVLAKCGQLSVIKVIGVRIFLLKCSMSDAASHNIVIHYDTATFVWNGPKPEMVRKDRHDTSSLKKSFVPSIYYAWPPVLYFTIHMKGETVWDTRTWGWQQGFFTQYYNYNTELRLPLCS